MCVWRNVESISEIGTLQNCMFIFFHNSSKLLVSYSVSLLVPESAIICCYIAMNNLLHTYSYTLIFSLSNLPCKCWLPTQLVHIFTIYLNINLHIHKYKPLTLNSMFSRLLFFFSYESCKWHEEGNSSNCIDQWEIIGRLRYWIVTSNNNESHIRGVAPYYLVIVKYKDMNFVTVFVFCH